MRLALSETLSKRKVVNKTLNRKFEKVSGSDKCTFKFSNLKSQKSPIFKKLGQSLCDQVVTFDGNHPILTILILKNKDFKILEIKTLYIFFIQLYILFYLISACFNIRILIFLLNNSK